MIGLDLNFFLNGFSTILSLVFIGCLVFLAIKTNSAGVMLIWITLLIGKIIQWISWRVFLTIIESNGGGELFGLRSYEFYSIVSHITQWLVLSLCSLGIIIIYNEWKQGKFQNAQSTQQPGIDIR